MSFKRDGDDLDMLRRLKVVCLCFSIRKLVAEFVSWWGSTRKQFLFYLPIYTCADMPEDGLSTGRNM